MYKSKLYQPAYNSKEIFMLNSFKVIFFFCILNISKVIVVIFNTTELKKIEIIKI